MRSPWLIDFNILNSSVVDFLAVLFLSSFA